MATLGSACGDVEMSAIASTIAAVMTAIRMGFTSGCPVTGCPETRKDGVAEDAHLGLRGRERLERHEIEVPRAELGGIDNLRRDVVARPDEADGPAELRDDVVGNERRRLDGLLPVLGVREIGIDRVDGVRN